MNQQPVTGNLHQGKNNYLSIKNVLNSTYHFLVKNLSKYIKIHWLFILLFTYTSVDKLTHIGDFQFIMWKSSLLEAHYKWLSYFIPLSELFTAILLSFATIKIGKATIKTRMAGLYLSLILMCIFTVYVGLAFTNLKASLPCSCGGIISKMNWSQHFLFNLGFLLLAIRGIRLQGK